MATGLYIAGTVLILATALPLFNSPVWWVRVFDFPRLHIAILGLAVILLHVGFVRQFSGWPLVFLLLLAAAVTIQSIQVIPHTPLWRVQTVKSASTADMRRVRLLIANVLQSNRNAERFLEIVHKQDPDIVLAVETDQWWSERLRVLASNNPHVLEKPQDNTYGLVLYSRLPLTNAEIRHYISQNIPSAFAQVRLRSGELVDLYGLHPEPPHPVHNESTDERDAELVLVAREVLANGRPAIVAGDLNDVAWSHTTQLFQRISRMLDPRVGRGLYNTFPATLPFLRFPLDHVFHSREFKLVNLARLEKFGSDHFPICIDLVYEPARMGTNNLPEPPDQDDFREADQKIQKGR